MKNSVLPPVLLTGVLLAGVLTAGTAAAQPNWLQSLGQQTSGKNQQLVFFAGGKFHKLNYAKPVPQVRDATALA